MDLNLVPAHKTFVFSHEYRYSCVLRSPIMLSIIWVASSELLRLHVTQLGDWVSSLLASFPGSSSMFKCGRMAEWYYSVCILTASREWANQLVASPLCAETLLFIECHPRKLILRMPAASIHSSARHAAQVGSSLRLCLASKSVICDLTFARYCAHCQSHKDSDLSQAVAKLLLKLLDI